MILNDSTLLIINIYFLHIYTLLLLITNQYWGLITRYRKSARIADIYIFSRRIRRIVYITRRNQSALIDYKKKV